MPLRARKAQLDPNSTEGLLAMMTPDNTFRAVTPSDTVNIQGGPARRLYIGGAGDVTAINENGTAVLFKAVPVGTQLNISAVRVNSTGTTATYIVAL